MPSLTVVEEPVTVHMAVNVADLTRSVAFYRVLFGAEPAKCHADYAKFEVADPPLVFSLMPGGPGVGGVMSHAGLRVADAAAVWAARDRLEAAGVATRSQVETRGCYAVQTKVWAADPDGLLWEVYVLTADIPHGDVSGAAPCAGAAAGAAEVLYRGPFRELADDAGRVFPRGRRVAVPADVAEALRQGPAAAQFAFFDARPRRLLPLTPTSATAVKFHFSLWVADLSRTVAFYRVLFGTEPAKDYPDYAKFELDRPPLVLSFLRQPAPRGASLNHVGLRLPDAAGLVEVQRRLERAGFPTLRQDGVECCYALQTKFWATDPDGVRWEVYTVHADLPRHGAGRPPAATPTAVVEPVPADGTWTHTTADPFPARLPFPDGALSAVQLLGTFNADADAARRLAEVRRVLKPGGRVTARALVGDRPYPGRPDFPGLMAKVKHVPVAHELLDALAAAGFVGAAADVVKPVGCVEDARGVSLQSLTASASAPPLPDAARVSAWYDGPFARLTDDDGTVFPRGEPVLVAPATADRLRAGPARFTVVPH